MKATTPISLDRPRSFTLVDGIDGKYDLYQSPRQLLTLLSKSEIVEYLIETGILNEVKDKEWKRV